MEKPELTDLGLLGPMDEIDRASHHISKCSACHEIISVEKAVADGPSTQRQTSELLELYVHTRTRSISKLRSNLKKASDRSRANTTFPE